MTVKELLEDLLIEFDELDMQPMIIVPDPVDRAKAWKHELTYAIRHLEAEVTREIFEEIEKLTPKKFTEKSQDFEFGYALAIQQIKNKIAELKKKYTEGGEQYAYDYRRKSNRNEKGD